MKKLLIIGMISAGLTGCMSSMNPFESDPVANPPAELVNLDSSIPVSTRWSTSVGEGAGDLRVKLVPKVHQGKVYSADAEGLVKAMNASNGGVIWHHDIEEAIVGGPGAGEGLVLVGTSNGELVALDQATGQHKWRAQLSSEMLSVPQAARGVVIAYTIDGKLTGFSANTGEQIWQYARKVPSLTLQGSSSPVIVANAVLCGFANGKLGAFEIKTGQVLWESTVSIPRGRTDLERIVDIDGDPLVVDRYVFVSTYQGEMAAMNVINGEVLWRRDFSSHTGISADRKQLYVTDAEDNVWAIDPRNKSSLWKQDKLKNRKVTGAAVAGKYIVVGDFEGYLHWLSTEDGSIVGRTRVGDSPITAKPVSVDGTVYIYSDGGELAAVSPPN